MTTYRKIIVEVATSADGFIARPDGDIDWLTKRPDPPGFYGMAEFMESVDTKILGRKTWDTALRFGESLDPRNHRYVFSRKPPPRTFAGVDFVSGDIAGFVKELRKKPGKHIWLMGGGEIIASFLDAGCIDEFMVTVMPVFIGEGIPLIAPRHMEVELDLLKSETFENGVVQTKYRVRNKA